MTSFEDRFDTAFLHEVRTRRLERNWTQSELARRTDGLISASTLAGYESGHRRIRLEAAAILAAALDIKLSTLVEQAENARSGSNGTRLDVHRLLQNRDPQLEPVRRWLTIAHPDGDGPNGMIALTNGALTALSHLMGATPAECRDRLAPYLGSADSVRRRPSGSSRSGSGSDLDGPSTGEGASEGDLIGVFQVATDRQP